MRVCLSVGRAFHCVSSVFVRSCVCSLIELAVTPLSGARAAAADVWSSSGMMLMLLMMIHGPSGARRTVPCVLSWSSTCIFQTEAAGLFLAPLPVLCYCTQSHSNKDMFQ